jgi:hypothetical protein
VVLPPAATLPGWHAMPCTLVVKAGCTALLKELCSLHQSNIGILKLFIQHIIQPALSLSLPL